MAHDHPKFEDDVPQFNGNTNEKFVEWVTVRLWEAEHKDETKYWATPLQERTLWTAEAHHQDIAWSGRSRKPHCGQNHLKRSETMATVTLEEKGQETLDNCLDARQGKTDAIPVVRR